MLYRKGSTSSVSNLSVSAPAPWTLKLVVVTTITYTPNRTKGTLPANVSLRLAGLASRSHSFKVKVSYHATVTRKGHRQTVAASKTLGLTFSVC